MEFCELTENEYKMFQNQHAYRDYLNSIYAMRLKQMHNWKVYYVGVKEGDEILCATAMSPFPLMRFFKYFYAQRGLLIDYNDKELLQFFTQKLKEFVKSKNGVYLIIDPNVLYKQRDKDGNLVPDGFNHSYVISNLEQCGYEHQGFTKDFEGISHIRWMSSLYLENETEKSILKKMRSLTKRSINKMKKNGIKTREMTLDEFPVFMKMLKHTAEKRNFDVFDDANIYDLIQVFEDNAKLILAYMDVSEFKLYLNQEKNKHENKIENINKQLEKDPNNEKQLKKMEEAKKALHLCEKKYAEAESLEEKYGNIIPMASGLFFIEGDECIYSHGAAYRDFMKYDAPYAVQWYMIQYSLQHHLKRYNFYGISGNFAKDSADYGVYEFKKGFGAIVEELVGDFILPTKKCIYKLYKLLKSKKA